MVSTPSGDGKDLALNLPPFNQPTPQRHLFVGKAATWTARLRPCRLTAAGVTMKPTEPRYSRH
jgi:hypothetical protein